jgi:hypothetical protein
VTVLSTLMRQELVGNGTVAEVVDKLGTPLAPALHIVHG